MTVFVLRKISENTQVVKHVCFRKSKMGGPICGIYKRFSSAHQFAFMNGFTFFLDLFEGFVPFLGFLRTSHTPQGHWRWKCNNYSMGTSLYWGWLQCIFPRKTRELNLWELKTTWNSKVECQDCSQARQFALNRDMYTHWYLCTSNYCATTVMNWKQIKELYSFCLKKKNCPF